jgi:hypothetical protein
MGGNVGFRPPKNSTPIYSKPSGGRGQRVVIGYSKSSPYGTATYDLHGKPTNKVADKVALEYRRTHPGGGGGLFGSITSGISNFIQDPAKATTQALQPVEKAVNYIGAHPEMQLALAMAVAVPVVGEYIGAELMAAGAVTSAEAASAAAIAGGATAAQAAAAAQAATATATVIGTAIASTTAQVAQGVPLEKAIENTAADVAVSQLSPAAAKKLDTFLHTPAVTDAITSTVASGALTASKGGSQADVEKAMTAGLAGSAASSVYKKLADTSPDIYSKTIGGATAGAVKGGTEGAIIGGASSALGSLGKPSSTTKLADDTGGGSDLEPYADPSTSGGAAPPKLEKLGGGSYYDPTSNTVYSANQVDQAGNLIPGAVGTKGASGSVESADGTYTLPEVIVTAPREEPYTPEITLPSGFKIPNVDIFGSNKPTTTSPTASITPLPSLDEPKTPSKEDTTDKAPAEETSVYKPDLFITTSLSPKTKSSSKGYSSSQVLGQALGTTTGLTSERGAGEIEGTGSGKPRKKVWNEESLKLKDALGV